MVSDKKWFDEVLLKKAKMNSIQFHTTMKKQQELIKSNWFCVEFGSIWNALSNISMDPCVWYGRKMIKIVEYVFNMFAVSRDAIEKKGMWSLAPYERKRFFF